MDKSFVEYFGRILMECVRDRTIYSFDKVVEGKMRGETGEFYAEIMKDFTPKQIELLHNYIIPDLVDKCIFNLLHFIETSDDIDIVISSDTEEKKLKQICDVFSSRLLSENGWKDMYSKNKVER